MYKNKVNFFFKSNIRHKFIHDKYEKHKFVPIETNIDKILNGYIDFVKENDYKKNTELLLHIFGQNNFNLHAPIDMVINI